MLKKRSTITYSVLVTIIIYVLIAVALIFIFFTISKDQLSILRFKKP